MEKILEIFDNFTEFCLVLFLCGSIFSVSPEIWTPDYFIGFWETYSFLAYKVLGNAMNRCFSTKCCFDKGHSSVAIVIVLWLLRRRRQRWWGKSFLGFNLILLTSCYEENSVEEIIFLLQLLFFSFGYHSGRFSYFFESPKWTRKKRERWRKTEL